jgi:hypothetical protein
MQIKFDPGPFDFYSLDTGRLMGGPFNCFAVERQLLFNDSNTSGTRQNINQFGTLVR